MAQHPDIPIDTAVPWWFVVSLRNRFYLKNFIETGTGYGDTALIASRMFREVHTIELVPDVFSNQRRALLASGNVHRYCGNSPSVLADILPKITSPSLFYLDGHWPGMGPKLGPECPLLDELAVICNRSEVSNDVICIDNAGLFINQPPTPHEPEQWPPAKEVLSVVQEFWPTAKFTTFIDVFLISNEDLICKDIPCHAM